MRVKTLMLALAMVAGPLSAQSGLDAIDPPETEPACVEAGGRWATGGIAQQPLCFLPTPDAGAACTRADDCTGFCLAETGTCSPETPRFGCFALLDLDGAEVTICID